MLLPPTLTLQYHFTDFGAFKPYVGAGVNYTVFFSQPPPMPGCSCRRGCDSHDHHLNVSNAFGAACSSASTT